MSYRKFYRDMATEHLQYTWEYPSLIDILALAVFYMEYL